MATLDNDGVPNNLTTGNHDVNTTTGDGAFFDQYFPPSRYTGFSWYGGYLGQLVTDPVNRMNKNNYELFSAGGLDFVILHLELDIPDYALDLGRRDPRPVPEPAGDHHHPPVRRHVKQPAHDRRSS